MAGRMTDRSRRRLLWLVNALMGAGIVAAVASALLPVAPEAGAGGALAAAPPAPVAPLTHHMLTLPAYLAAFSRPLQEPLFDRPTPPPPEAGPPTPPPVVLEGTVVDRKASFAAFRPAGGRTQLVGIGESVMGVQLISVTARSATVRWQGRTMILVVPQGGAQP